MIQLYLYKRTFFILLILQNNAEYLIKKSQNVIFNDLHNDIP